MPSFELKHTDELKIWLIKELEPICDADPEVLSDYVLALLKHDSSDDDLQASLQEQLEDFLAEQTTSFVEKTLNALRSQSYLPESKKSSKLASSVTAQSQENHLDANVGSSRKRSADDEGRKSPAKSFRDGDGTDAANKRPRDRDERDRRIPSDGIRQNRPKAMCRDFHQRGFCARGDSCKYDHSLPAAPVPGNNGFNMHPMMGMQIPPMAPAHMNQGFGMAPQQHAHQHVGPNNNTFTGMGPQYATGGPGMGWNGPQAGMGKEGFQGSPSLEGTQSGVPQGETGDLFTRMADPNAPSRGDFGQRGGRGGIRGGRGGAHAARGAFEKKQTSNTTLVIENVPVENLELVKVNEFFKKFGTITNIQIDLDNKKALVSFSQPAEAKAAHSSPEVIFNNRFVKVYFQRLDEALAKPSENTSSAPKVAPGPPLKNNFVPGQNKFVRPNLALEKTKEIQEAAQKKLDELMSEQKEIMTKLTGGSVPADEKKTLMTRFGSLEGEIKQATEEVRAAVSGATTASNGAHSNPTGTSTVNFKEQRELKQREQMDRELEALKNSGNAGSTTEELKQTLARLQAEAAQLGIDSNEASGTGTEEGYRGGFRGRARGAGFRGSNRGYGYSTYRGRGGAMVNRPSMTLDNRPSRLYITDIPDGSKDENRTKVKEFFQQFGETHSVDDQEDGSLIVHYKIRSNGERALRSGLSVPEIGSVKAKWADEVQAGASSGVSVEGNDAAGSFEEADGEGYEEEGDRDENFRR